jgi:hypothetical protein
MATINTYNQILTVLEDVATRHYQINNFGIGDKWEIGTNTLTYPVLWVNPISARMERGNNDTYASFEVSLKLKVLDLVHKDESNEDDVLNDTLEILRDIVTEFSQHPYYVQSRFEIVDNVSFTPFTENTDEECSGWMVDIRLRTPNIRSFCGIPVSSIPDFSFPAPTTSGLQITDVQYVTSILNTDGNLDVSHVGSIYTVNSSAITTNSSSFSTRITNQEQFSSSLDATFWSEAEQTTYSSSISTRQTTNETNIATNTTNISNKYDKTGGVVSGSATISGSLYLRKNVYFDNGGSTLTSATSSFDLSQGNIFINTLSGSTHMEYTNPQIGTYLWIFNGQSASSGLTFDSGSFQAPAGTTPTLTATVGATDMISGLYDGSKMIIIETSNISNI